MRTLLGFMLSLACVGIVQAQTAEELVAKNLEAKGGVPAIKALTTLRMTGKFQQGTFNAPTITETKAPDLMRQSLTIQGMTAVQAYDGKAAWQIQPFGGRKDPELMGEDDARSFIDDSDFYGPLVDYQQKGNRVEYLGKELVDGDDALRLQVTLKNGDIYNYYLDPDTFLEIRIDKQTFIRGAVQETVTDVGSYKKVNNVYFPFSVESWPKASPGDRNQVTYDKIEANVALNDSMFQMPSVTPTNPPQTHAEPPVPGAKTPQKKAEPPKPKPPAKP
ncbi:MAG TPA: hypothetical protein VFP40_04010 [Terriglobales bacterium]|nr:hypothetical protein [Terriglobales bacterium]